MWNCPVPGCGKECKNAGAKQHMTKMHKDWVMVDLDTLTFEKRKKAPEAKPKTTQVTRQLKMPIAVEQPSPVPKPIDATPKEGQRVKRVISRRIIIPPKSKPKPSLANSLVKLKEKMPKREKKEPREFDPNFDPEPTLELVTKMPLILILGVIAYKYFTDPRFFTQFLDNDVVELYKYVFTDITSPGAIIILSLTAIVVFLLVFMLHKMIWRFLFKDLYIRKGFSSDGENHRKGPGMSFEGRIYLVVGDGVWDRLYRRITKRPKPTTLIIFFRRGPRDPTILNPFKVLASCHRGYLDNSKGGRYIRDGLFKRTVIATHLRRDTENESTVYWFEDGIYEPKKFNANWYTNIHKTVIKENLGKVSKACLMDSSTQKEQMKSVISWLPTQEIEEQERVWKEKVQAQSKSKG